MGSEADWVSADDYPLSAIEGERQGISQTLLYIDRQGRVTRCAIVGSSGHADLDAAACSALSERARFAPAYDNYGDARSSRYFKRVRWQLPEPVPDISDIVDTSGVYSLRAHTISYVVEIDGSVSDCREYFEGNAQVAARTNGCENLANGQLPIIDDEGNPVRRRVTLSSLAVETDAEIDEPGFTGNGPGEDQ